jgi:glycosyltransferase involved in cell wall biosynthesis
MPVISVCIPSYNRPEELSLLLESIAAQQCDGFEVVISDDCSPRFSEIQSVVRRSQEKWPQVPHSIHRNDRTLGYDANLRRLLSLARGDYCLFMGDDDLLLPGAIQRVHAVIAKQDGIGVILRSYCSRDRATGKVLDVHRYFHDDRFFPRGTESLVTCFRRSTFISGYTVHRMAALSYDTDRFDGTLLYQLHLTANILLDMNGFYISEFQAVQLPSAVWHFGVAESEAGRFAPGKRRPEQCVNLVQGMLQIARAVQESRGVPIYRKILRDLNHYIYGPLTWHSGSRCGLLRLVAGLWRLGLGRSVRFWAQVIAILVLGRVRMGNLARRLKTTFGSSRLMGAYYQGVPVHDGACPLGAGDHEAI